MVDLPENSISWGCHRNMNVRRFKRIITYILDVLRISRNISGHVLESLVDSHFFRFLDPQTPPSNPPETGSRWLEMAWFTIVVVSLAIGKWAFSENWVIWTRIRHKKDSVQPCLKMKRWLLIDESTRKWKKYGLTVNEKLGCGIRVRKRQPNWAAESGPMRHWKHTNV